MRVATATSSELAARAAREIATEGGNAVDCALAAALVTMNSEPGVCALAGGAYVTVWPAGGDPVTIDGNVAVPGIGLQDREVCAESVSMEYGGGVTTLVGCGSVAVPGSLAAVSLASDRFGLLPWRRILQPAIDCARMGFPLSSACHYYLQYSGSDIFARSEDGKTALHDSDGKLRDVRSMISVPHLADTLEQIANEGSDSFYRGDIAAAIVKHVRAGGGLLTAADMAQYEPLERKPVMSSLGQWQIAANPPPAVGGSVLAALLAAFARQPATDWNSAAVARLIEVQRKVLRFRRDRLDLSDDIGSDIAELMQALAAASFPGNVVSSATVHTSSVDDAGNICAITASSGYGSGEMPAGTGLWLNNCLGELELNRRGLAAGPPAARLPSNMTPGAARGDGKALAFGSPGADRITTAVQQFLLGYMQRGLSLQDAVAAPRLHVELAEDGDCVAAEPGLPLPALPISVREYPALNMYFGGVGAALYCETDGFDVAADPRREGGTCIAGG